MTADTVWHGTQAESIDLVNAIGRNCTCEFGAMNIRVSTCPPHAALTADQRWLDHLIFVKRIAERLRLEEWRR
jgi:hypothetical protein